jgi:hypothetical protein
VNVMKLAEWATLRRQVKRSARDDHRIGDPGCQVGLRRDLRRLSQTWRYVNCWALASVERHLGEDWPAKHLKHGLPLPA